MRRRSEICRVGASRIVMTRGGVIVGRIRARFLVLKLVSQHFSQSKRTAVRNGKPLACKLSSTCRGPAVHLLAASRHALRLPYYVENYRHAYDRSLRSPPLGGEG